MSRLSIGVHSGSFERVHYALVLASAAAAIDRRVTLFFTMEACRALRPAAALDGWAARDETLGEQGLATLEELLTAAAELDVRFLVCELGMRAVGLAADDLRGDLGIREAGAVTFLNDAGPDAQMMFI